MQSRWGTGLAVAGWLGLWASSATAVPNAAPPSQRRLNALDEYAELGVIPQELDVADRLMAQVTSVSQLADLPPTHWAYTALQSIVNRYACIVGYPENLSGSLRERTFRGNQYLTRYEFAAGLNACLDKVQELIRSNTGGFATQEDLNTIKRLQEEFATELATLRGRVDALEARTSTLEKQQFSTTTKLFGQVVFGVQGRSRNRADFFPVDGIRDFDDPGTRVNVITNVQLSLFTQFSPRSLLLLGLQAGSGSTGNAVATNNVRLSYEGDTGNSLVLSDLTYRHLLSSNLAVIVGPTGVNMVNVFRGANRVESAGFGPISRFAQRNPVLGIGNGRGGVGFDWQIASRLSLQGVYSTSLPDNAIDGGIFGSPLGETAVGVQLAIAPSRTIDVALNYVNAYSPLGRLGTGVGDDFLVPLGTALKTDAFGATVAWRISPKLTIGAWGGYTVSSIPGRSGNVETTNWMAFLNFPDLFSKGSLGGIYVGQPPKIVASNLPIGSNVPTLFRFPFDGSPGDQPGTTTHIEVFYRWRISDNITITPGVIVLVSPGNIPDSDTITIGAVRTTFTF